MERTIHGARQRMRKSGLADSGHVFYQQVSFSKQAGKRKAYDLRLAANGLVQGGFQAGDTLQDSRSCLYGAALQRHSFIISKLVGRLTSFRSRAGSRLPAYSRSSMGKVFGPGMPGPYTALVRARHGSPANAEDTRTTFLIKCQL